MSAKSKFIDALDNAMMYKTEARQTEAVLLGIAAILEELEKQRQ